ncbi:leucine-rich repeat protein [Treponema sp.]|uniref:leucine-rich repeat protein n=1 Tax=Treponema sp. TaxID=166 RepID=UPI00298E9797|nr:leucine-rich repeat protein [Treponema sp.]MCQ2241488.1 leucine-rich repeat domain-containing protein [Treponema sp.]
MNNIKIKTLFITSLFLIFFSGCSGLFNLTPDSSADDNNTFSIVLNNEASNRNITPYELTAERLSLVKEWKIKFTDLEGKTYAYSESSKNGKITLKLPFIGNCSIEIEGSFTADGKTFSLKGSKSNVSVTAGSSVNISVEIIKNGTGTLNYKLKLDENTFGQIGTNENKLNIYFQKLEGYRYIDYEAIKDLTFDENIEKDDKNECFHAILSPLDGSEESITLSCNVFYKGWSTMEGRLGKKFEYFEISSQEQIPAGTYMLRVFAVEEKGTPVDITPFDNIVEIFGDTETVGTGISYDLDSKIGDLHYYVTKNQSSFNGFTPKSRTNFTALVKTLCNPMYASKNIYLHFSEDEDISDYRDWEIWKEWKQNCHIYGLKGDYPASEQIFDGDDFYMGYYKTIFATYDATKAGSGTKVGVGPDRPIDANVTGYVSLFYKHGYTICYSDISTANNYSSITTDLSGIEDNIENIILQTSNGYSKLENWSWQSSSTSYGLTLGSGIKTASIHDSHINSITLGDDFETIEAYSFGECSNLQKVVIGKNVTTISKDAFVSCTPAYIIFPESENKWYQNGTQINSENLVNAELFLEDLSNGDYERLPAPADFGVPFAYWTGKVGDYDSYAGMGLADEMFKYLDSKLPPSDVVDFTFDKHGNFYAVVSNGSSFTAVKYNYSPSSHSFGFTPEVLISNDYSKILLDYNYEEDLIYMNYADSADSRCIKSYDTNGIEKKSYTGSSYTDFSNFAVKNNNVYVATDSGHIVFAQRLSEADDKIIDEVDLELIENSGIAIFGEDAVTGITENTDGCKIADMQIIGDYLCVLVRQVGRFSDKFYSRGAVVRLIINEDGSLGYKDTFGWHGEGTALNCTLFEGTASEFLEHHFTGPARFVAIKPDELVIADDGAYWITNGKLKNINRIVTVDLETFAIKESYEVTCGFDETAKFTDGGSNFNEIQFVNAE